MFAALKGMDSDDRHSFAFGMLGALSNWVDADRWDGCVATVLESVKRYHAPTE